MGLVLHHLHVSQSERIVWLLEELNIPYTLHTYDRSPLLAPPELKNIPSNTLGTAPVLQDGSDDNNVPTVTICESGAIAEYILSKYGSSSSLAVDPSSDNYAHYLYWLHASNASLQPAMSGAMTLSIAGAKEDSLVWKINQGRRSQLLGKLDARLAETGGFLAGNDITAADIMTVFSLSTERNFFPYSLAEYPNILAYLGRIGKRSAYQRAMEKGDPGMELFLGPDPPEKSMIEKIMGGSSSEATGKL